MGAGLQGQLGSGPCNNGNILNLQRVDAKFLVMVQVCKILLLGETERVRGISVLFNNYSEKPKFNL